MILPATIDIQIIDKAGNVNSLANVLFGLKVFVSDESWHNYSIFKSNTAGYVRLTKQDIIDNTELKWEENTLSIAPTKFELYVWNGEATNNMVLGAKRLLELYDDRTSIQKELNQFEIADENMQHVLEVINKKAIEDRIFYESIKGAVNNLVKITTTNVQGVWIDNSRKSYQFIIE